MGSRINIVDDEQTQAEQPFVGNSSLRSVRVANHITEIFGTILFFSNGNLLGCRSNPHSWRTRIFIGFLHNHCMIPYTQRLHCNVSYTTCQILQHPSTANWLIMKEIFLIPHPHESIANRLKVTIIHVT